jgi:hypothetical protein
MINYFPIIFTDFDIIQKKVLDVILKYTTLLESKFFYIPVQEILEIKELKNQIENIGLLEYIHSSAINLYYKGTPVIHKDTGNFIYSLNIPISGYANTHLSYFESYADPELKYIGSVSYTEYDKESCTLIEKFETTGPAIVNTQIPHAFENFNNEPRLVLLLRLDKRVNSSVWLS